jgi:hypothetical protein
MRMTKLALASGLVFAMMIGASTSAFAWSGSKAEDAEFAKYQAWEAARLAAVQASYQKCLDAWDARWAAKDKAQAADRW